MHTNTTHLKGFFPGHGNNVRQYIYGNKLSDTKTRDIVKIQPANLNHGYSFSIGYFSLVFLLKKGFDLYYVCFTC